MVPGPSRATELAIKFGIWDWFFFDLLGRRQGEKRNENNLKNRTEERKKVRKKLEEKKEERKERIILPPSIF